MAPRSASLNTTLQRFERACSWGRGSEIQTLGSEIGQRRSELTVAQCAWLSICEFYASANTDHDAAQRLAERALHTSRESGDSVSLARAMAVAAYERPPAAGGASRWVAEMEQLMEGRSLGIAHAEVLTAAVDMEHRREEPDVAMVFLKRLATEHAEGPGRPFLARALYRTMNAALEQGDLDLVERLRPDMMSAITGQTGAWVQRAHLLSGKAALARGDMAMASWSLDVAEPDIFASPIYRVSWAELAVGVGRLDDALSSLQAVDVSKKTAWLGTVVVALVVMHLRRGDEAAAQEAGRRLRAYPVLPRVSVVVQAALEKIESKSFLEFRRAVLAWGLDPALLVLLPHTWRRFDDPTESTALRIRELWCSVLTRHGQDEEAREIERETAALGPLPVLPVDRFDVMECIGTGGNAQVFRAIDTRSGLEVAMKVLHNPLETAVLEAEGALVARLRHPHIVPVLAMGQVPAFPSQRDPKLSAGAGYVVFELVRDGTLLQYCGLLPWFEVRRVLIELLLALGHAHGSGVLHLDLKPDNVLVESTANGLVPRLTDFGLCAALTQCAPNARRLAGTPMFMAPEQWAGRLTSLQPHTDLYAFGYLAWQLITGVLPFEYTGDLRAMARHHRSSPRPPLEAPIAVPEGLEGWLHTLMAPDPRDRFPSAWEASEALCQLGRPNLAPAVDGPSTSLSAPTEISSSAFQLMNTLEPMVLDLASRSDRVVQVSARALEPAMPASTLSDPLAALEAAGAGAIQGWEEVQQALWRALENAGRAGSVRVVELCPDPGLRVQFLTAELVQSARERGLVAHVFEGDTAGGLVDLVKSVLTRVGLASRDPRSMLAARFPEIEADEIVEVLEGRSDDLAVVKNLTRLDLGLSPSVLVLRGDAVQAESWRVMLGSQPCLVVVEGPGAVPDQKIAVPRMSPDHCAALLQGRVPLVPELAAGLVDVSGADPGTALEILRGLAAFEHLRRHGNAWRLSNHTSLPRRPSTHPAETTFRLLEEKNGDDACLRWISGRVQVEPRWSVARLLDRSDRPIGPTRPGFERYLRQIEDPALLEEMRTTAVTRRSLALVLVQQGRAQEAVDVLVAEARATESHFDFLERQALLDLVLKVADAHEVELPGAYYCLRVILCSPRFRSGLIERALAIPGSRAEALYLKVRQRLSAEPVRDLHEALALDPPDDVAAGVLYQLGLQAVRAGDVQEALSWFWKGMTDLPWPMRLQCTYGWQRYVMRHADPAVWRAQCDQVTARAIRDGLELELAGQRILRSTFSLWQGDAESARREREALPERLQGMPSVMLAIHDDHDGALYRALGTGQKLGDLGPAARLWLAAGGAETSWQRVLRSHDWNRSRTPEALWIIQRTRPRVSAERIASTPEVFADPSDLDLSPYPGWA